MIDWISGALVMAGATLALLAGVGVVRMPDVFTRMQASTKASTLGLGCLLAALAIRHPEVSVMMRALSIGPRDCARRRAHGNTALERDVDRRATCREFWGAGLPSLTRAHTSAGVSRTSGP
jgi:hypothetical protein